MSLLSRFKFQKPSRRLFFAGVGVNRDQRSASPPDDQSLCAARNTLERILTENIIPFWYPGVIDHQDGGYRLNHDLEGRWGGPASKFLVTQARMVWFLSRLVNSKYANPEFLEAARHGYAFLRDRMWDKDCGGFYWEVDSSGRSAKVADKRIYGQAFGLYALTEYAYASGDATAKATAKDLFDLMEAHAHDVIYGGYRESLQRDWRPIVGSIYNASGIKRMNTHMHLLEAFTTFHDGTRDPRVRERLLELIFINSNSVVRKNVGACTDRYLENWEPLRGPDYDRVSYGHDVENIWLLIEACKSTDVHKNLLLDLYRTLFHYALDYGFDWSEGGFYESGPLGAPADRRDKIWWVQAEGLLSALQMHHLTDDELYLNCFSRTLQWIFKHQADWQHGDWHAKIGQDGKVSGVKAGAWKAPYHNGRAMLSCLDLLASLERNEVC